MCQEKLCKKCDKTLNIDRFSKNRSRRDGRQPYCKDCIVEMGVDNILSRMYKGCRNRARKLGVEFSISKSDLIMLNNQQDGRCAVTGVTLNWEPVQRLRGAQRKCPFDRVSIDRIDPTKGYTQDNIQLVTEAANRIKGTSTMHELLDTCRKILDTYEAKA